MKILRLFWQYKNDNYKNILLTQIFLPIVVSNFNEVYFSNMQYYFLYNYMNYHNKY